MACASHRRGGDFSKRRQFVRRQHTESQLTVESITIQADAHSAGYGTGTDITGNEEGPNPATGDRPGPVRGRISVGSDRRAAPTAMFGPQVT